MKRFLSPNKNDTAKRQRGVADSSIHKVPIGFRMNPYIIPFKRKTEKKLSTSTCLTTGGEGSSFSKKESASHPPMAWKKTSEAPFSKTELESIFGDVDETISGEIGCESRGHEEEVNSSSSSFNGLSHTIGTQPETKLHNQPNVTPTAQPHLKSSKNDLGSISANGVDDIAVEDENKCQLQDLRAESSIRTESSHTTNIPSKTQPSKPPIALLRQRLPHLPPYMQYDTSRLKPIDDGKRSMLLAAADLSTPLLNGWALLPHQRSGVARGLIMRRLLLAYDMGLGKTLIACVWAKAFRKVYTKLKVIIIAPVSTHKDWVRTALKTTGLEFKIRGTDVDDLAIESWGKIPKVPDRNGPFDHFVLICDEAHSMQNMSSGRTKSTLALAGDQQCVGCLLLTGTPMKNGKPSNLFPLLKAVRHPLGDSQKKFEIYFCEGRDSNYGRGPVWEANGSSNLPSLHAHTLSHILHKTKKECLADLPPKMRSTHKISVAPKFQMKYTHAMNELAKAYHASQVALDTSSEMILGAFQKLRVITSTSKIQASCQLACDALEKEPAVVIFTCFVNVAKSIHQKLSDVGWNGELLTGETPQPKRQAMVDRFQEGTSAVFVATFGAGGIGLTLTAARTIILLDRPWTPGDAFQAEDRIWRIGQTKPVRCVWVQSFEVDKLIDDMISQKNDNSSAVVGGKKFGEFGEEKVSIFKLIKNMVPKDIDSLRGLNIGMSMQK